MLGPKEIGASFDRAIDGIKKHKFTEAQSLSGLLISVGGASQDDTLVLIGVSIATTANSMFQLVSLSMLDAEGVRNLLSNVSKDTIKALRALKKEFATGEEINEEKLISPLGLLARSYVTMVQKLTELQQMGALGASGGAEGD